MVDAQAKNTHLNDQQLQAYLDGLAGEELPRIKDHLQNCAHCRAELHAYRAVYRQLNSEPSWLLSADFADRVVASIDHSTSPHFDRIELLLTLFVLVSGVITLSYIVDIADYARKIVSGLEAWIPTQMLTSLFPFSHTWGLLLAAGGILLVTGILDRFVVQYRH